jgi:hypothetical protein
MIYVNQENISAAMNLSKMEIDFEFPIVKFKNNNRSEIKSEIKNIFNFNSDAEK